MSDLVHKAIPLTSENGELYYIPSKLEKIKYELESFLDDNDYMNSRDFSRNVLFSQEIKSNNNVEGYYDDVGLVYAIVNKKLKIDDIEKTNRIKNLYNGYKYIFEGHNINETNLKKLYSILSKNLLSKDDLSQMGLYYRKNSVYIFYSSCMNVKPDLGMNSNYLDKYMNQYFEYLNNDNNFNCSTDYFIKSQIAHFQFVNIHPYYDINGRTSRTCSMWYLLNNKVYPYIIFNRAISLNKGTYYKIIREVKEYSNVTYFLKYMLDNVKIELEKEYIMDMIKSCSDKLTAVDYQTMYYILSMKGILTVKDFATFYNTYNAKKRVLDIYNEMLMPLFDKGILKYVKNTSSNITEYDNNFIFKLNDSKYEYNPS